MNTLFRQSLAVGCIGLAALWVASPAIGGTLVSMGGSPAGVGGDPYSGPFEFDDNGMAMVTNPDGGPIPIYIDPSAPPWTKQFVIPPNTTIIPGQTFSVWEEIQILPPPPTIPGIPPLPLTDWHEHIHGSDPPTPFGWAAGGHLTVHDPLNPTGPPLVEVPGEVDPSDPTGIWFGPFPPIPIPPNGLPVWIHKDIVYTGTVTLTASPNPLYINIWEYPTTPEPSTAVLAWLGGLALIGLKRRHRPA